MSRLVALTGATGFIGRHFARRLSADGWQVRALVRRANQLDEIEGVSVIHGDLSDRATLARLVDGASVVVHCAGLTRSPNAARFHAVNVVGTSRVVAAACRSSSRPRFVLISSIAAREPGISSYARSKRGAEEALRRLGAELDWTVLRPPAVYGPEDQATLKLFKMVNAGVMFFPAAAKRDGARLSLIHVGDLADALAAILSAENFPSRTVFEMGDPSADGHSWRDIGEISARALGRKVRYVSVPRGLLSVVAGANLAATSVTGGNPMMTPGKVREMFHPDWVARDNALATLIGWSPKIGIEDGFFGTVRWYRDNHLL